MRGVAAGDAVPADENDSRIFVQRQILRKLVVSSLYKRAQNPENGFAAAFCQSRSHGDTMLFGNADVNEVPAEFLAHVRRHADSARSTGVDEDDLFVFGDFFLQIIDRNAVVVFAAEVNGRIASARFPCVLPQVCNLCLFRYEYAEP